MHECELSLVHHGHKIEVVTTKDFFQTHSEFVLFSSKKHNSVLGKKHIERHNKVQE